MIKDKTTVLRLFIFQIFLSGFSRAKFYRILSTAAMFALRCTTQAHNAFPCVSRAFPNIYKVEVHSCKEMFSLVNSAWLIKMDAAMKVHIDKCCQTWSVTFSLLFLQ